VRNVDKVVRAVRVDELAHGAAPTRPDTHDPRCVPGRTDEVNARGAEHAALLIRCAWC
jgi:hypothetical protein